MSVNQVFVFLHDCFQNRRPQIFHKAIGVTTPIFLHPLEVDASTSMGVVRRSWKHIRGCTNAWHSLRIKKNFAILVS